MEPTRVEEQNADSSIDTATCDSMLGSSSSSSKIYPELLGLDQHSPVLIDALKTEILIPPPSGQMPELTDSNQGLHSYVVLSGRALPRYTVDGTSFR